MALGDDNWNLALIVIMIAKFDRSMDAGQVSMQDDNEPHRFISSEIEKAM